MGEGGVFFKNGALMRVPPSFHIVFFPYPASGTMKASMLFCLALS